MNLLNLAERRWLPDWLIRIGIRRLLAARVRQVKRESDTQQTQQFAQMLRNSPLALATETANEQHYEVPAEFFQTVLGPRLKYSCCYYAQSGLSLAEAEEAMLDLTCQRAEIEDGMTVLDLGCGWGSLSLWIAEQFPGCSVTAVSNSHGQRRFIERRCLALGLENVRVVTADMREFSTTDRFDRVVSIEMFEHMRNYEELLNRVTNWLMPEGKLFVHIFCHRRFAYLFKQEGRNDWMSQHFFTEGLMPSVDLLSQFSDDLRVDRQWEVNGDHYAQTCEDWLDNLDRNADQLLELVQRDHGPEHARIVLQRWRMFFMACAKTFRYGGGDEWFVAHYLMAPVATRQLVPAG